MKRSAQRAFTLIEILIVVVILGILAAIVIPQFTDASEDAMNANLRSQLQTVRSQLELFNVQAPGNGWTLYNAARVADGTSAFWDDLVTEDYLQQNPRNPFQAPATADAVGPAAGADVGWIWAGGDLTATDGMGVLYDEINGV